jgi:hypothetical protein
MQSICVCIPLDEMLLLIHNGFEVTAILENLIIGTVAEQVPVKSCMVYIRMRSIFCTYAIG